MPTHGTLSATPTTLGSRKHKVMYLNSRAINLPHEADQTQPKAIVASATDATSLALCAATPQPLTLTN